MILSQPDLFKAHVKNLRAVNAGILQIELRVKEAIAKEDVACSDTLLKILLLLTGTWAECRLRKLLAEPAGFSSQQITTITNERSQVEMWLKALELGYRSRYNIPNATFSKNSLGATPFMRYEAIYTLVDSQLRPLIEMRNTLAHGQWERPFNSAMSNISTRMCISIRNENTLSARFKRSILLNLSELIHDLVTSPIAFERDFDKHFKIIEQTRINMEKKEYGAWKDMLINKYKKGQLARTNQTL